LQIAQPTAKERGITVRSRTTKAIGAALSTCFTVDRSGESSASWTECYAANGELTYADGDYARSLVESMGFHVLSHPADTFSNVQSIEATGVTQVIDPKTFLPPYPVAPD
jgi:hypothetical protein